MGTQITRRKKGTMTALKQVYTAFCSFGKGTESKLMDGKAWVKCLKDSKVINFKDGINSTTADLTFAKICARGKRKIGFVGFKKALEELANRSSLSYENRKQDCCQRRTRYRKSH